MKFLINQIKHTYGMAEPEERSAVLNNFAFLSALQAVTYLIPIILLPYLFRVIGPEKFGLLAFAQAFIQYFMIFTDYGFNVSATREISVRHSDREAVHRIFYAVMTLKIIFAVLSGILLAAAVYFVPKFHESWQVYALSFGMVLGNAFFPYWFFQGIEKMRPIADLNIFGGILSTVLIFTTVRSPENFLFVPLIQSAVAITTGLWGQYLVIKTMRVPFRLPARSDLAEQLRLGWNVFVSVLSINAYTTTRIFAVGFFTTNTITGFYAAAEKIAGLFQTFPLIPFSQALFPRLSKIFHKNKMRAFEFMEKIQKITVGVSAICLPLGFVFADALVRLVCGGHYPETVLVFRLLLVSVLFIGSNAFRVQFLLIAGHSRAYLKIHMLAAVIGAPLILTAIGYFSYVGAALATVIIEAGIYLMTSRALQKNRPHH